MTENAHSFSDNLVRVTLVQNRTLSVRVIQRSVGLVDRRESVTVNCAGCMEFWYKVTSVFVLNKGEIQK
jgi:hypothetical protein